MLGTARHALDELYGIVQVKVPLGTRATLRERAIAQTQYAKAEGLLGAARAYFYQCHDEVWRKGEAGESFNLQDRALMRLGNVTSAKLTLQAVDPVADAAGMKAAKTSSPIERCWRDAHTAIQHMLLNTARFEVIARAVRARSWFATGLILSASGKDRWERSGEAFTYSKRCGFRSVR